MKKAHIVGLEKGKKIHNKVLVLDITEAYNKIISQCEGHEQEIADYIVKEIYKDYNPAIIVLGAKSKKQAMDTAIETWGCKLTQLKLVK